MSLPFDLGDLVGMALNAGLSPEFIAETVESVTRDVTERRKEKHLETQATVANHDDNNAHSTGLSMEYSTSPISELRPILLSDMKVEKTYKGRYLLCRVTSKPSRILSGMKMNIKDAEGNDAQLGFYNYPSLFYAGQDGLDTLLPLGTVLIIREPTYKMTFTSSKAFICVHSPSDAVFLEGDDPVLRGVQWKYHLSTPLSPNSVEGWRTRAASEFKKRQFLQAAVSFTNALRLDPKLQVLLLNRAEVYLRLGWYSSALHDTKEAMQLGPITDDLLRRKAVVRSIKANYGLCRYEEVVRITNENPDDTDCKNWLERAKRRIIEKTTGKYDWFALITEGKDVNARPDVAEYCEPVIVKERVGEPGVLGVFVTRDVEIGELLMVARPLTSNLSDDAQVESTSKLFMPFGLMDDTQRQLMVARLIHRLCGDAQANTILHSMYAGPSQTRATYPPEEVEQRSHVHPLRPVVDVDVSRVLSVISLNEYAVAHPIHTIRTNTSKPMGGTHGAALYVIPSFCNHSCVPTANRITVGDVMIVRSSQRLKTGDEVTVWYVSIDTPKRWEIIEKKWHFTCKCTLCEDDRADGEQSPIVRDQLVWKSRPIVDSVKDRKSEVSRQEWIQHYASIKGIVEAMEKTYKKDKDAQRHQFRFHMVQVYTAVSSIALGAFEAGLLPAEDILDAEMEILENAGLVIKNRLLSGHSEEMPFDKSLSYFTWVMAVTRVVQSCLTIATGALRLRSPARVRAWVNAGKWVFGVAIADDDRLFKHEFNSMLHDFNLKDYC